MPQVQASIADGHGEYMWSIQYVKHYYAFSPDICKLSAMFAASFEFGKNVFFSDKGFLP